MSMGHFFWGTLYNFIFINFIIFVIIVMFLPSSSRRTSPHRDTSHSWRQCFGPLGTSPTSWGGCHPFLPYFYLCHPYLSSLILRITREENWSNLGMMIIFFRLRKRKVSKVWAQQIDCKDFVTVIFFAYIYPFAGATTDTLGRCTWTFSFTLIIKA